MKVIILNFILIFSLYLTTFSYLFAQNERFIRSMFADQISKKENLNSNKKHKWVVSTPLYQIDLNEDGVAEHIQVSKKDAEEWFVIMNSKRISLLEVKLDRIGMESFVYKVRLITISKTATVLIIYHYQGYYKDINFLGRTKVYFVSIDNKDLSTLKYYAGPTIWEEKESFPNRYSQRFYDIKVEDLDLDGTKEIFTTYGRITHIYTYQGKGRWLEK